MGRTFETILLTNVLNETAFPPQHRWIDLWGFLGVGVGLLLFFAPSETKHKFLCDFHRLLFVCILLRVSDRWLSLLQLAKNTRKFSPVPYYDNSSRKSWESNRSIISTGPPGDFIRSFRQASRLHCSLCYMGPIAHRGHPKGQKCSSWRIIFLRKAFQQWLSMCSDSSIRQCEGGSCHRQQLPGRVASSSDPAFSLEPPQDCFDLKSISRWAL